MTFLHVFKAEQRRRCTVRLDQTDKRGGSAPPTRPSRLSGTSTCGPYDDDITAIRPGPWYVIPVDYKHVIQAMAGAIAVDTIGSLDLQWPTVSDEDRDANVKARSKLEAETND